MMTMSACPVCGSFDHNATKCPKGKEGNTPLNFDAEIAQPPLDQYKLWCIDVERNFPRFAELGGYTADRHERLLAGLLKRIPTEDKPSLGLDAGLAVCLGLLRGVPDDVVAFIAKMHANIDDATINTARDQLKKFDRTQYSGPEVAAFPVVYWAALSGLCADCDVGFLPFKRQIEKARDLAHDSRQRSGMCALELDRMGDRFRAMADGTTFVIGDGGAHGAYLDGHTLIVEPKHGIYFLATYKESLGLEWFQWGTKMDPKLHLPMSGPVGGSRNFVKCADLEELVAALKVARHHLSKHDRVCNDSPACSISRGKGGNICFICGGKKNLER